MTTTEERRELVEMAKAVHEELRAHNASIRLLIAKIESVADEMKLTSADEITAGESVTKRDIRYGAKNATYTNEYGSFPQPIPTDVSPTGRKRRACSLCQETGHWATNCPNAHIEKEKLKGIVALAEAKRVAKAAKPKRTLTPEHKAKLVNALAKARAARSKK